MVVYRWAQHPLRVGDLVDVVLPLGTNRIRTIRSLAGLPGDFFSEPAPGRVPEGHYYVLAYSTNGIDSRGLGPVPFSNVLGKVVFILK